MAGLYVMSTGPGAGKTSFCLGFAMRLRQDGLRVGYFKPIGVYMAAEVEPADADWRVVRERLGMEDPPEVVRPVLQTHHTIEEVLARGAPDHASTVQRAYRQVARDRDVVLADGAAGMAEGTLVGLSPLRVTTALSVPVLLLARYVSETEVDAILASKEALGDRMLGVLLNAVPRGQMDFLNSVVVPLLRARGITVYGAIPEDRRLMAVTVRSLAEHLDGQILVGEEQADQLVESLMVGAMAPAAALDLFRRRGRKAVITGGDRADIQSAALETDTRCLILTGNLRPETAILTKSQTRGVPVVLVRHDTLTAVELAEKAFAEARFYEEEKLQIFQSLLALHLDYTRLKRDMGLKGGRSQGAERQVAPDGG